MLSAQDMSDQWFSALMRANNAYIMDHLEDYFLALDESGNSSLAISALYTNKEAITAICNLCINVIETSSDKSKITTAVTSLAQAMTVCLRNDEAATFALLCPSLLSAKIASKLDMVEKAIEASAYSIVEFLLQDEEIDSEQVKKILQSIHPTQSDQYNKIINLLIHQKQSKEESEFKHTLDRSKHVRINQISDINRKTDETVNSSGTSGIGLHTITEEWITRATKSMLQEAIKVLQVELSKEQVQSKKYQEIVLSILNNEKQSHMAMDSKIRCLTEQLENQTKQLCEKDEEIERLKLELSVFSQQSSQISHPTTLTLTPSTTTMRATNIPSINSLEKVCIKEDIISSYETESICKQMLSEYSTLKSALLTLGLESSIILQNFDKVSALTEIANTEIQTLKKSCLDAMSEAEEIRDRLCIVQHERDALYIELQQLKEGVQSLRQSTIDDTSRDVDSAYAEDILDMHKPPTDCRTSDSVSLAAQNDGTMKVIDTMTIYSYLEDDEGKKGTGGILESGVCDTQMLIEKLEEYGVQIEMIGTNIYLRVIDHTRLNTLLQDSLQQPSASILYPSEFSVANFRQIEQPTEQSCACVEELQPSKILHQQQKQRQVLEEELAEAQGRIIQLTAELVEKDKTIAELNQFIANTNTHSTDYNNTNNNGMENNEDASIEKVACILYQRALCERDTVFREMEENREFGDNLYSVSFVTQRKLNSILPCEESSLRELFSKACLHHDILHKHSDTIWLDVLATTIKTRNYHLSEYLRSKLTQISDLLHEQCNKGASLHGFVPMNNLTAVYLLAPRFSNIRDQNNRTALMIAAELDQLDIVRVLLPYEAGAQTQKGHTALMMATQLGHLRIVQELAPLEACILDQRGRSAVYYATDGLVYKDNNLSKQLVEVIQGYINQTYL